MNFQNSIFIFFLINFFLFSNFFLLWVKTFRFILEINIVSVLALFMVSLLIVASILILLSLLIVPGKSHMLLSGSHIVRFFFFIVLSTGRTNLVKEVFRMDRVILPLVLVIVSRVLPFLILGFWRNIFELLLSDFCVHVLFFVFSLSHRLSFMEEIFSILHKVDLFDEQICLFLAEVFVFEQVRGCLLQLVVSSLDLFDVDLLFLLKRKIMKIIYLFTYLVHFAEPVVHDLLLICLHGSKGVEEVSRPHYLRVHDHFVDEVVSMGDQGTVVYLCLILASFSHWGTTCFRRRFHNPVFSFSFLVHKSVGAKVIQQKLELLVNANSKFTLVILDLFLVLTFSLFLISFGDGGRCLR